jgi:hypothetical protein
MTMINHVMNQNSNNVAIATPKAVTRVIKLSITV